MAQNKVNIRSAPSVLVKSDKDLVTGKKESSTPIRSGVSGSSLVSQNMGSAKLSTSGGKTTTSKKATSTAKKTTSTAKKTTSTAKKTPAKTTTKKSTTSKTSAQLLNALKKSANYNYKAKTEAEIKKQAQGEYKSYYNTQRQAAQQEYDTSDLALQQQREGLQATYDKQREASAAQYRENYSQADRQMLNRGMQRSSYAMDTLNNVNTAAAKAQQDIYDAQAAAEGNIDQQRALLSQQLAKQLSTLKTNEAADVLARVRELQDQEYERGFQARQYSDSLSSQLYGLLYQQQRDAVSDSQWEKQFNESVRQFNVTNAKKSSTGGGGYSKSSSKSSTTGTGTGGTGGSSYNSWLSGMNQGGNNKNNNKNNTTTSTTSQQTRDNQAKAQTAIAQKNAVQAQLQAAANQRGVLQDDNVRRQQQARQQANRINYTY